MKKNIRSITAVLSRKPLSSWTVLAILLAIPAVSIHAADILWQGGAGDYNTPANWVGGLVPTGTNNAVNNSGTNNGVQIGAADPAWTVNQIKAGNGTGDGAFVQNGQTVTLTGNNPAATSYVTSLRLGLAAGSWGVYTLNAGSLNYGAGSLNVGELGGGILNINGGTISGSGNFADAYGTGATPSSTTATMDGGLSNAGYTWFAQGFYTANTALGLPPAGSLFASTNLPDHNYRMAPDYTVNNAIEIDSNYVTSATITLTTPAAYSALSFLGSAGNLAVTVSYMVHHADTTTETGSVTFPDWFATNAAAFATGGRVSADGKTFQIQTSGAPFLYSLDTSLTNTTSPVTSIDLAYASSVGAQGLACIMALSGSTGSGFNPINFTGYNEDMVVDANTANQGYSTMTSIVNQTAGSINITNAGQLFVGNYGPAIYNLSGGTIDVHNYIAFGRSGGNGTFNMTGGILNQDGGGNLLVGTGYQAPSGATAVGVLNQGGGTINCTGQFLCPENSPSMGTYNASNNAVLYAHDWIAIGRSSGSGVLNISGNAIIVRDNANDSGANFVVGSGGPGTLNQNGGAITNLAGQTWIGESSSGTWNLNSGVANLGTVHLGQVAGGSGIVDLNGGTLLMNEMTVGSGGGEVIFNGGTVVATANNVNLLHDVTFVGMNAGGVTIDSQTNNITISQEIDDYAGGGLTKVGSGTLTLTGANTYTGDTMVNAGTLIVGSTAGSQNINYTVADTAGFGVMLQTANGQVAANNLTLGGATGGALNFDFGAFGNPVVAPLNVNGALTGSGTFAVNITAPILAAGTIPLMQYGSLAGSPNFVMGNLPAGVVAHLATSGNMLQLVVTSAGAPRWDGNDTGMWDLGPNQDWYDLGTMALTAYTDGHPVIFDDNAAGTTTVNLTATVTPVSVTFTNNTKSYSIIGMGKITGATGVSKTGSAATALLTANDYTGPTVIAGGTLSVTNLANGGAPSGIGASAANAANLVIANATFSYGGTPVTTDRGYTATNATIDAEGDLKLTGLGQTVSGTLYKVGPATMTYAGVGQNMLSAANVTGSYQVNNGAVILDGSAGTQTNRVAGEAWVGGTTNAGANLVLTNTSLGIGSWFAVARGTGSSGYNSGATLYNSKLTVNNVSLGYANGITNNRATASLALKGASWLYNSGGTGFNFGESAGSVSSVSISDNSWLYSLNRILIGMQAGTTGSLVIQNNGALTNAGYVSIAQYGTATATLKDNAVWQSLTDFNLTDLAGTAVAPNNATLNISNNALLRISTLYMAKAAYCTATINQSGGTVANSGGGDWRIGGNTSGATNQLGVWNLSGGAVNCSVNFQVGAYGTGSLNQSGGIVTITGGFPDIGRFPGGVGYLNISGGTFNVPVAGSRVLVGEQGTGVINVSGTGVLNSGANAGPDNNTGLLLGLTSTGIGSLNLTNGSVNITNDTCIGRDAGSQGALNLYGGVFATKKIYKSTLTATGAISFYGGILKAMSGASNNFVSGLNSATIYAGGATIDSDTNIIAIAQPLLAGGNDGGLAKLGVGALYLNGVNTYTNTTVVSAGMLGGTGTLSSPVTVAAGAVLAAGSPAATGALTINNALNFNAGSSAFLKIGGSGNDQINGLTAVAYNGTLVVTNTTGAPLVVGAVYQLFNSSMAGTGNFTAVSVLPTGAGTFDPTTGKLTITSNGTPFVLNPVKVSGGNLIVTGSGGAPNAGYTVLTATNVATPSAQWTTNTSGLTDASGNMSNAIPVSATEPARFFRVRQP